MLTFSASLALLDNPQVGRLETDHLAVAVHLAMNGAAYADNGASRTRLAMEAVEQQKLELDPPPGRRHV